jgi:hypothetical protein
VGVELEQVVCGGHQSAFRLGRGSASSHEPVDAAVVFDLPVDRLDGDLPSGVELAAAIG